MTHFLMRPDGNAAADGVSAEQFQQRLDAYFEYLRPMREGMPRDLWRFFAEDFFHDGPLSRLEVEPVRRRVRCEIVCPNVKRFDGPGQWVFVNVGFEVVFQQVWSVALYVDDEGEGEADIQVLAAEIGTEREGIRAAFAQRGETHQSLTIHTNRFWLTVVFAEIAVTPLEVVATELMLSDARYVFPFAR